MFKRTRVPFKQQMADSDCGPACLAMICAYYGHDIPVQRARATAERFGPPQSTRSIIKAARDMGFETSLVAADLESIKELRLPCILFWEFSHFVVLEKIDRSGYTISDPSVGRRRVSFREMDLLFTGIAVQLIPTQLLKVGYKEKNKEFRAFVLHTLRGGRVPMQVVGIALLAGALQVISLIPPAITMYVVDTLMPAGMSDRMGELLLLIVQLGVSIGVLVYFRSRMIVGLSFIVDRALVSGYLMHTVSLPMKYFLDRSTPELQSRMNSNTVIRDALSTHTASGFLDLIFGMGYIAVLLYSSPALALVTLAIGAAYLASYFLTSGMMRDNISVELRSQAQCSAFVSEVLNGIVTVKSSGGVSAIAERWDKKLMNYLRASKDRNRIGAISDSLTTGLQMISPLVVFWFAANLYFSGALTLGQVLAANTIALMALVPISGLVRSMQHVQLIRTHAVRFGEAWLHQPEAIEGLECPDLGANGSITFENVSFRYLESEKPSLVEVNLTIPLGARVGIVGPSGSGKSTFVFLLLGYQTPTSGRISINGIDTGDIRPASLRDQISHVPQEGFLFNSSIRENIAFGHENMTVTEIERACTMSVIKADIDAMPMGLETRIGEFGVRLSGGQRQRICIARAFAKNAPLLVLDEATSSLDSVTEQAVAESAASIKNTQIIVSHRLGTVRDCDMIIVFENGAVANVGVHADLLKENAFYRTCHENQSVTDQRDVRPAAKAEA